MSCMLMFLITLFVLSSVEQFLSYLMGVQIKNFYFVIWSLEEADKDWMIWLVGGWVSVSSDTGSPR